MSRIGKILASLTSSIFYLSLVLVATAIAGIITQGTAQEVWLLARNFNNMIFTLLLIIGVVLILFRNSVFLLPRWQSKVAILYSSTVLGVIPLIFVLANYYKFFNWLDDYTRSARWGSFLRFLSFILLLVTLNNFSFLLGTIFWDVLGSLTV